MFTSLQEFDALIELGLLAYNESTISKFWASVPNKIKEHMLLHNINKIITRVLELAANNW